MPTLRPRLARLLPGILGPWLACAAAHAQIHEEKPPPGLEEGILAHCEQEGNRTIPVAAGKSIGTGDFSIVCRFTWIGGPPFFDGFFALASGHDGDAGWKVILGSDASISFTAQSERQGTLHSVATPKLHLETGRVNCLVISAHRDARQPGCGIWMNGVEIVSGVLPPVDLKASLPEGLLRKSPSPPDADNLTIYNRALTRPEILELSLRSSRREEALTPGSAALSNAQKSVPPHVGSYEFPKPKHPAPPPNGPRFIPQPDETIALIGGTEAVTLAESGELEALLLMAFPQTRFHFRSLAWEGDTVFKQDRPMNFGSLEQQLRRVNAGAVFVMFGRQECLEAKDEGGRMKDEKSKSAADSSLQSFKTAFEKLLAKVENVTPNIVVIGPPPFEKKEPPLRDLSGTNKELDLYIEAMRVVAEMRAATFIAINAADHAGKKSPELTSDGVQLTPKGAAQLAELLSGKLGNPPYLASDIRMVLPAKTDDILLGKTVDPFVRDGIRAKNRLWHDYWRPSNWAFLHGDRTNQPSSRDPVNPQIRFFPAEQEKYLPLIKDAEDRVFQLVQEAQKKLP